MMVHLYEGIQENYECSFRNYLLVWNDILDE